MLQTKLTDRGGGGPATPLISISKLQFMSVKSGGFEEGYIKTSVHRWKELSDIKIQQ